MAEHVTVIAEAGVNHNGDPAIALEMIDVAADAGCDVVKFQTFKADLGVSEGAPKAAYQRRGSDPMESQRAMLTRLELEPMTYNQLVMRCAERGISFMSSPFDLESLSFLVEQLGQHRVKIASGELVSGPLLLAAGRAGVDVIISTGMSTTDEIRAALGVLAHGYLGQIGGPTRQQALTHLDDPSVLAILADKVTLLHCTSLYPTPPSQVNLLAMETLVENFGLPVGYSDHTLGSAVAVAAVACGATVIEKHFTMSRDLPGPDHTASLESTELTSMVADIRCVEQALGSPIKMPTANEIEMRAVVRKSLIAAQPIAAGDTFRAEHLAVQRPGTGIQPLRYWDVLGTPAPRAFAVGDLIVLNDFDQGET